MTSEKYDILLNKSKNQKKLILKNQFLISDLNGLIF